MNEKPLFPPPVKNNDMPGEDLAMLTIVLVGAAVGFLALWKFAELIALACDAIKKSIL